MRVPWSRNRARAASVHFVKVQGDNARLNGKTRYWSFFASESKLVLGMIHGSMCPWDPWIWFESRLVWKTTLLVYLFNVLFTWCRSRIGLNPHPFLELWNKGYRTCTLFWEKKRSLWSHSPKELCLIGSNTLHLLCPIWGAVWQLGLLPFSRPWDLSPVRERLRGDSRESRSKALSFSLIPDKLSYKCLSVATRAVIDWPIALTISLVA